MSKKKDSFKPWLSRPTVNRSVTLPLTRPLTQRLSNLNEFHPNELDPYLLFDAQDSMIGTLENPTLDLDPSKPDTLNVITATRAGTATYTDVNGNIASAPANTVRVDQTQGAELTPTKFQRVGYTDFSSGVTLDGVTKTNQSTPYGDGILLTQDTSSGEHNILVSVTNTGQHTFSLKVKPDGVTKFSLSLEFSTSNSEVVYDTVAETATIQGSNVSDASLEDLGSGWFLVKLTNDSTVSIARIRLRTDSGVVSYVGDGVSGLFLANPQVEEGTTASSFVANTSGSPKFIASAVYGPRVAMILVEPSATNLVDNSSSFQTTGNVAQKLGIDAPDGTNTATRITNISGASGVDAVYSRANSVTPSSEITGSIYLRGEAGKIVRLYVKRYSVGTYVSTAAESVLLTGEWQRYESPSFTLNADNTNAAVTIRNDASVTAEAVDLWGGQIESGSVSTSVIPTSGSTVTRAKDDLVISGSDFDFYNQSEGTVYCEFEPRFISNFNTLLSFQDNSLNNSNFIRSLASTGYNFWVQDGGAEQAQFSITGGTPNSLNRFAGSYKASDHKASLNGVDGTTTQNGTVPSVTQLLIGSQPLYGGRHLNGHIKRLIYWPYHSDSL